MCGLVGIAGDLNHSHNKLLKTLLYFDALRGEDSTGVAFINKFTGDTSVAKQLGHPYELFAHKPFIDNMNKVSKVLIGHNRYATQGGISKHTAHPFEFDTLVGVHNGTLSDKWKLADSGSFKVDSENLYHHIEEKGLEDAIGCLPKGPNNAYSLVWWDKLDGTLNFLRNEHRPMVMCRSLDDKVLFWASEGWMLSVALSRAGIKHGDLFETSVDHHYAMKITNTGEMLKPVVKVIKQTEAPSFRRTEHTPVVKQASNVIEITAKDTSTKKAMSVAVQDKYLALKGVEFEIINALTDKHGGKFLALFDPFEPSAIVRLYYRNEDKHLTNCIGEKITADLASFNLPDSTSAYGYFKVSPWTVKGCAPREKEQAVYLDAHGKPLTKQQWEKLYSTCDYCSSPLMAEDDNRFSTDKQCFCPDCSTNPAVLQHVYLK